MSSTEKNLENESLLRRTIFSIIGNNRMIRELNRSDVDVVAAYISEALDGEFRKVGEVGYSPGEP
jgi:hypothetical protein